MAKKTNKTWRKAKRSSGKSRQPAVTLVEQTVRIAELGRHCDGMTAASDVGTPVPQFVPFALPGELVRVQSDGKRGRVLEVLEPSEDRAEPFCPHFTHCGGCTSQHLRDAPYREWKRRIVETALRYKNHDVTVDELIDAHGDGRRRVTFHIEFAKGKILAGFMQARSRQLIDLDTCPILAPGLANATAAARLLAAPFAKQGNPFDISMTDTPQGLDCDIRGAGECGYDAHIAIAEAAAHFDLARVSLDSGMALERRKPMLPMGALRVPLPPDCFLQATTLGEEIISKIVLDELTSVKKIADLFCGVGPFALRLSATTRVFAADSNASAIDALKLAVRFGENLKPVEAVTRDLFRDPIYHGDLNNFDAVIFNPARAGAEAQAEEIALSDVKQVICVSCDPASLARDARILVDGGYSFERATPVDQFKYSPHVETVAVFRRA